MELNTFPVWLRRRPLLVAAFRQSCNRWRRGLRGWRRSGFLVAIAAMIALPTVLIRGTPGGWLKLDDTPESRILAGLLAAGVMATITAVRLQRVSITLPRSWLASTVTVDPLRFRQRAACALGPTLPGVLLFLVGLFATTVQSGGPLMPPLWLAVCAGLSAGIGGGLVAGSRPVPPRQPASRYVWKPPGRHRSADLPGSARAGLSSLVIRHAQASTRPTNSRLVFLAAILLLPAGLSGIVVLTVLMAWALLTWLLALAAALPGAVRQARGWLQSTTLPFRTFWWLLIRRALLHHLAGWTMALPVLLALDASAFEILRLAAAGLLLFLLYATTIVTFAWFGRDGRIPATMATAVAAVAEHRFAGVGACLAAIATALCYHQGERHART